MASSAAAAARSWRACRYVKVLYFSGSKPTAIWYDFPEWLARQRAAGLLPKGGVCGGSRAILASLQARDAAGSKVAVPHLTKHVKIGAVHGGGGSCLRGGSRAVLASLQVCGVQSAFNLQSVPDFSYRC